MNLRRFQISMGFEAEGMMPELTKETLDELKRLLAENAISFEPAYRQDLIIKLNGASVGLMETPIAQLIERVFSNAPALIAAAEREHINAQHEETGRLWSGPRCDLPSRYIEIPYIPPAPGAQT